MSNAPRAPAISRGGRGGGGGRSSPHQQPTPIHQQSGVPFGHVPAYLPGSASLVEELDQKLLIVLRDGKHLVGTFCSYDQFSNMILQDAFERRIVVSKGVAYYSDIPLGLYVVRGDSMVLTGLLNETQNVMKEATIAELEEMKDGEKPLVWDFDTDLIA